MDPSELKAELESERAYADRLIDEKAEAIQALQVMAEAARVLSESFRMAIKFHGLDYIAYQKTFSRYHKARKLYDEFRMGTLDQ